MKPLCIDCVWSCRCAEEKIGPNQHAKDTTCWSAPNKSPTLQNTTAHQEACCSHSARMPLCGITAQIASEKTCAARSTRVTTCGVRKSATFQHVAHTRIRLATCVGRSRPDGSARDHGNVRPTERAREAMKALPDTRAWVKPLGGAHASPITLVTFIRFTLRVPRRRALPHQIRLLLPRHRELLHRILHPLHQFHHHRLKFGGQRSRASRQ